MDIYKTEVPNRGHSSCSKSLLSKKDNQQYHVKNKFKNFTLPFASLHLMKAKNLDSKPLQGPQTRNVMQEYVNKALRELHEAAKPKNVHNPSATLRTLMASSNNRKYENTIEETSLNDKWIDLSDKALKRPGVSSDVLAPKDGFRDIIKHQHYYMGGKTKYEQLKTLEDDVEMKISNKVYKNLTNSNEKSHNPILGLHPNERALLLGSCDKRKGKELKKNYINDAIMDLYRCTSQHVSTFSAGAYKIRDEKISTLKKTSNLLQSFLCTNQNTAIPDNPEVEDKRCLIGKNKSPSGSPTKAKISFNITDELKRRFNFPPPPHQHGPKSSVKTNIGERKGEIRNHVNEALFNLSHSIRPGLNNGPLLLNGAFGGNLHSYRQIKTH